MEMVGQFRRGSSGSGPGDDQGGGFSKTERAIDRLAAKKLRLVPGRDQTNNEG
jgi:hypothetical protein